MLNCLVCTSRLCVRYDTIFLYASSGAVGLCIRGGFDSVLTIYMSHTCAKLVGTQWTILLSKHTECVYCNVSKVTKDHTANLNVIVGEILLQCCNVPSNLLMLNGVGVPANKVVCLQIPISLQVGMCTPPDRYTQANRRTEVAAIWGRLQDHSLCANVEEGKYGLLQQIVVAMDQQQIIVVLSCSFVLALFLSVVD